jgi:hypothetical protein
MQLMEHQFIFLARFSAELLAIWLLLREPGKMELGKVMKKFKEKKELKRIII